MRETAKPFLWAENTKVVAIDEYLYYKCDKTMRPSSQQVQVVSGM
jgi:hypothetical protein